MHVPVWIGIDRGIFERHGFRVDWRTIGKSMDRLNAISSGEAQFASLGEIAMLSAMAQGNDRFLELKRGIWDLVQEEVVGSLTALQRR